MSNELSSLSYVPGSQRKSFRVGRGIGSGNGKTAGRGTKGQNSRSGSTRSAGFEGGQMPIQRRLPKRGFRNIFRSEWDVVNLRSFDRFEAGSVVGIEELQAAGLVSGNCPVKVLGDGSLSHALTIKAHAFSAQALKRIELAGAKAEVI